MTDVPLVGTDLSSHLARLRHTIDEALERDGRRAETPPLLARGDALRALGRRKAPAAVPDAR